MAPRLACAMLFCLAGCNLDLSRPDVAWPDRGTPHDLAPTRDQGIADRQPDQPTKPPDGPPAEPCQIGNRTYLETRGSRQLAVCDTGDFGTLRSACEAATLCNGSQGWTICPAATYILFFNAHVPTEAVGAWVATCLVRGTSGTFNFGACTCSPDCALVKVGCAKDCQLGAPSCSTTCNVIGIKAVNECATVGENPPISALWRPVEVSQFSSSTICCRELK